MKKFLFLLINTTLVTAAIAQSSTSTIEYQKINRQAVVNEVPFPEKTVRDAIDNKMQQMGYKGKDSKGFTIYKGVSLSELGTSSYDLYFNVDRKSRKEKEIAVITLMLSKGFDSFIADSTDATVINNAKTYLNNIRDMIAAYDLELQINDQADVLKKADKKLSNLKQDGEDMEKKKKKLEADIEQNKKDAEAQATEIEKQKQILETLKGKRKSG